MHTTNPNRPEEENHIHPKTLNLEEEEKEEEKNTGLKECTKNKREDVGPNKTIHFFIWKQQQQDENSTERKIVQKDKKEFASTTENRFV
jgi:hypothetical protein